MYEVLADPHDVGRVGVRDRPLEVRQVGELLGDCGRTSPEPRGQLVALTGQPDRLGDQVQAGSIGRRIGSRRSRERQRCQAQAPGPPDQPPELVLRDLLAPLFGQEHP